MSKKGIPYQPSKASINLSVDEEGAKIKIDGDFEDLVFLLSLAIQQDPTFIGVLQMTISFDEYMADQISKN